MLNSTILDLAVDPSSPQTLYAAGPARRGVAKSTDGETTWLTVQDATDTRGDIEGVAVDGDGAVFALYGGAIFKSADGGSTWKEISLSRDGGHTWQLNLIDANTDSTRAVLALAPDPVHSQRVYVLAQQSNSEQVFRTDDGGRTWMATGNPMNFAARDLAVDPNDPDILYTGSICQGAFELQQEPSQLPGGSSRGGGGCAVGPNTESGAGLGAFAAVACVIVVRRRRTLTPPASTH